MDNTDNTEQTAQAAGKGELVVLLHGILLSGLYMRDMEVYLRKQGYETLNISYPSTEMKLEDLADDLHTKLSASEAFNSASTVHFVAHSMGGLLARYYIHEYRPANLGCVVTAGSPHNGSEFADFLSEHPMLGKAFEKIFGPAGSQLRVKHEHDATMKIDYPLGVIAGKSSINPLSSMVLPGENDGTVAVESTKIAGMADHITLPVAHTFMMFSGSVQEQTVHFLRQKRFNHPSI